jgi:hypothetical protein
MTFLLDFSARRQTAVLGKKAKRSFAAAQILGSGAVDAQGITL